MSIKIIITGKAGSGHSAIAKTIANHLRGLGISHELTTSTPYRSAGAVTKALAAIRESKDKVLIEDIQAHREAKVEEATVSSSTPWTLYWRSGKREVIHGVTIADAFSKAGYGGGAMPALDFYAQGDDTKWKWSQSKREWVQKK